MSEKKYSISLCLTECKDINIISSLIEKRLNQYFRHKSEKVDDSFSLIGFFNHQSEDELFKGLKLIRFIHNGLEREASIYLNCDSDYQDFISDINDKMKTNKSQSKIIITILQWGDHEEILEIITGSLISLGDLFISIADKRNPNSVNFKSFGKNECNKLFSKMDVIDKLRNI